MSTLQQIFLGTSYNNIAPEAMSSVNEYLEGLPETVLTRLYQSVSLFL